MITTHLSSTGQITIPQHIFHNQHWQTGQELLLIEVENGLLLKPKSPFKPTRLEQVAKCLSYKGKAKTLDDMEAAIATAILEENHGCG